MEGEAAGRVIALRQLAEIDGPWRGRTFGNLIQEMKSKLLLDKVSSYTNASTLRTVIL